MPRGSSTPEPSARALEFGLCLAVVLIPWPFGAVTSFGRDFLEGFAAILGAIWLYRAFTRPVVLPSKMMTVGIVGLLLLATVQMLPLGESIVGVISPHSVELRTEPAPGSGPAEAEERLLGVAPSTLDAPPSISLDPGATASALRTGVALSLLLLVAASVAATSGVTRLAQAMVISAAFQGLYGLLVLGSGFNQIWNREKIYYLSSATGTYINKNHFACFLAMTLACGLGMLLAQSRRPRSSRGRRARLLALLGNDGSRLLVWAILFAIGLAGLLASLSRAGIAVGLLALAITAMIAGRRRGMRTRVAAIGVVVVAAAIPMLQLGADQLVTRFSQSTIDLTKSGARSTVWADTIQMAMAFPVEGAGFGTFEAVYPAFRSPEVRLFYSHSHNDLLQLWAEAGIIGVVLLVLILIPIFRTIVAALTLRKGTIAVGFAAALLAVLFHALVDFNFHIPANAAIASIVAGCLIGLPWKERR